LEQQQTSLRPAPVAYAPAGVFRITGTFRNVGSLPIRDLYFQVTTLTNGNLLLNADGGPGGVGSRLSVPAAALGSDGVLSPNEQFTVSFDIGLQNRKSFTFLVDAYGIAGEAAGLNQITEAPVAIELGSFGYTATEADLEIENRYQVFLPFVRNR
jgi:hypothetical protein